jgi:pimeloyl-ACP methyl ester carboxylesterase
MASTRVVPPDHHAFTSLPVDHVAVGAGSERMAFHISGEVRIGRPPVICIAGYHRNMSDHAAFIGTFQRRMGEPWPVITVDLKGRGRSADRRDKSLYATTVDAQDLSQLCTALCVERAVFLGQGYGGQVVMALGMQRPRLIAGSILIDAGPVTDPRGLVRLRNNLKELEGLRSEGGLRTMFRRMLGPDYPGLQEGQLDLLAARTHYLDKRNRVQTLFDPHLLRMLEQFEHDDVLEAQWPLFNALSSAPMMMMRTQLTEQLRREVFEEMLRRRSDADGYIIEAQGSPALLDTDADAEPIAEFVKRIGGHRQRAGITAVSV